MALQYGLNLNSSELKDTLEKTDITNQGVRTWRSLFGGAGLSFASQQDALVSGYSDAIAQAYKANYDNAQNIASAGLSTGATRNLLSQNASALTDAYNTYLSKYASDVSSAASAYSQNVTNINSALTGRAQNFSDLFKSAYDYFVSEIANSKRASTVLNENGNPQLVFDGKKDKEGHTTTEETTYLSDKGYDWMLDKDTQLIKSFNELSNVFFDQNGNLTTEGRDFYNAILHDLPAGYRTEEGTMARSFDEWLSDTNSELRDWWVSGDQYNYNLLGTNIGTTNKLLGVKQDYVSSGVGGAYGEVNVPSNYTPTQPKDEQSHAVNISGERGEVLQNITSNSSGTNKIDRVFDAVRETYGSYEGNIESLKNTQYYKDVVDAQNALTDVIRTMGNNDLYYGPGNTELNPKIAKAQRQYDKAYQAFAEYAAGNEFKQIVQKNYDILTQRSKVKKEAERVLEAVLPNYKEVLTFEQIGNILSMPPAQIPNVLRKYTK